MLVTCQPVSSDCEERKFWLCDDWKEVLTERAMFPMHHVDGIFEKCQEGVWLGGENRDKRTADEFREQKGAQIVKW